jgi:peptide/nickel transport system substrate-binding protein
MRKFLRTASRPAHLPVVSTAEETLRSFTASGRALFYFFAGTLVVSSFALLYLLNTSLLVPVPAKGGTFTEGVIGSPRFVNPVLAVSEADRDLTALVYAGLLKATPEGSYVPELAASYQLDETGTVYTVTLREEAYFHDGKPVTASDIVFTVSKIQDPAVKSPLRATWEGIAVEEADPRTVRFTLKSPYAPFIKNLTLGVLPRHRWQGVSPEEFPFSELNTVPVGAGPFSVNTITRSASGIPTAYELEPNADYVLGAPYLERMVLRFYQDEAALASALKQGQVEAASGLSPTLLAELPGGVVAHSAPLNRVFGVFFNQNQSELLRDRAVREGLFGAIDRDALVADVLAGFGTPVMEPVPPGLVGGASPLLAAVASAFAPAEEGGDRALIAREKLIDRGWEPNAEGILQKTTGSDEDEKTLTLSFSLATGNVPELRAAAEALREEWSRMGAQVEVQVFESGDLSQNVIRPRKYDALLFGEVVGRELDLYAFWHSSQRNDPGLNIALYANTAADRTLEELRTASSASQRLALYGEFLTEIEEDLPAVFLYAPDFVYAFPANVTGLSLGFIENPSDRFLTAHRWHKQTEKVWPFLDFTINRS